MTVAREPYWFCPPANDPSRGRLQVGQRVAIYYEGRHVVGTIGACDGDQLLFQPDPLPIGPRSRLSSLAARTTLDHV